MTNEMDMPTTPLTVTLSNPITVENNGLVVLDAYAKDYNRNIATPFILRQLGLLKFKAWAEPLPGLCFFRARRAAPENILRIACLARKNLLYFSQHMRRRRIMALHYLETGSTEPEFNLAFEEYVLENKREGDWLILGRNE